MPSLQLAVVGSSSNGGSGVGLVVTVVVLTIGAALVLSWLIGRLPEKTDGVSLPFTRRRRKNPFDHPPGGPANPPPKGPFDN